jgi:hypothetical protein
MAFQGGPLSVIGITPSFITQTATQAVNAGATQVFQGAGQSFFGAAGQALVGNLAGSAVNVALNSVLGTQVTGPGGIQLDSGANFLATTLTPFVTSTVAAGINQSIQQSLQSAGPFGTVLSTFATTAVNQLANGLTNSLTAATTGTDTGSKPFPGAGSEPPADYAGGNAYTLGPNGGDVVFSIQPANQGPQAFGLAQSYSFPTSVTTLPFNELSSMTPAVPNATANAIKSAAMNNQVGTTGFSTNTTNNFNTSVTLQ